MSALSPRKSWRQTLIETSRNDAEEHLITVFSAALDCSTAEERVAYLDRACADTPGLRQRVEALLRAHARAGNFLGDLPVGQTVTAGFKSLAGPGPASSGRAFDEEVRSLLRSRLILVHLLSLGFVVLLAALSFANPTGKQDSVVRPDHDSWLRLFVPFAESLVGSLVLWRSRALSLRSLRVWELVCFVTLAAYNGYDRFDALAHMGAGTEDVPTVEIAFRGLSSLQGFGTLILAYGVLIPNTRRRSLLVVAGLTAVPLVVIPGAVAVNPVLREGHFLPLTVQWALIMMFPAAIAVFAASRAAALQRRAFDAERRAERIGQYVLKRKLGEGGMGEVWLAEHGPLKRPCAVKFIRPDVAANPAMAARFAREVQAVTGLSHVNTVRVYDYGRADDGSFYFVMEYLDGPTLEELVKKTGPLPPPRVVYLLRQVCGALAEAHAAGLVHRDLKPGNVIVATLGGQRDMAKLLDFGLVQDLSGVGGERLTRTGMVLGTPAYLSPEQAAGESAVDARGDVYSLGAVAFFALTGRPPFEGPTLGQLLAAHRFEPPPSVTALRSDVPADLAAVIARCLAKDPADRFRSAADLDQALGQCACAFVQPNAWTHGP
ncbi:MAG TPA: serine/threonine-protein kinase [Gemmataceae bacterium]|nr:serine/threonine-protein kinase [Gemmataceae bacterium]